jgi:hypothetical protein
MQDFAYLTRYRESIFCRHHGTIDRGADWMRLQRLHAQGQFIPDEPDDAEPNVFVFRVEENARFTSDTQASPVAVRESAGPTWNRDPPPIGPVVGVKQPPPRRTRNDAIGG